MSSPILHPLCRPCFFTTVFYERPYCERAQQKPVTADQQQIVDTSEHNIYSGKHRGYCKVRLRHSPRLLHLRGWHAIPTYSWSEMSGDRCPLARPAWHAFLGLAASLIPASVLQSGSIPVE
jgi:hypothetical protein